MKFKKHTMAILCFALTITACHAPDSPSPPGASVSHKVTKTFPVDSIPLASELGETKDTLVVAFPMDVRCLNPLVFVSNYDSVLQSELFLPLVRYDSEQSRWQPVLADKLDWSDDRTQLRMTLKQGYTWSDGQPLSANDVKFTYDMIGDPRVGSPQVGYRKSMVTEWNPKVVDEHTLEWHFHNAYDPHAMMIHLSMLIVPKHSLADKDPTLLQKDEFSQNPVTSGPWVVAEKQSNDHLTFIPNPNFHGSETMQPRLKKIIFRIIPDPVTRSLELEQGSVDAVISAPLEDVDRWAGTHPELKVYPRKYTNMGYMGYGLLDLDDLRAKKAQLKTNEKLDLLRIKPHPIFGDVRVRRALAKAVNLPAIREQTAKSRATGTVHADSAVSLVSPAFTDITPAAMPMPYSPEQAIKELADAGWQDSDSDGVLDKNGRKFEFTVFSSPSSRSVLLIQSDLHKIGVEMRIENMDTNSILGKLTSGEYDAYMLGYFSTLNYYLVFEQWDPQTSGTVSGYNNPQIKSIIDQLLLEPDSAKSNALLRNIQDIYYADQPILFLGWSHALVTVNQRFHGMQIQDVDSPLTGLYKWWVQPNEVKYH